MPLALLMFNVGVEAGQLVFVLGVLSVLWVARHTRLPTPAWTWRVASYTIGGVAAFWTIERVAGAVGLAA